MTKSKNLIGGAVVVVAAAALTVYIYRDMRSPVSLTSEGAATSTGVAIEPSGGAGNYTVKVLSNDNSSFAARLPNLDTTVTDYGHLDQAALQVAKQNIATISAALKQNPNDLNKWLQLAVLRKILSDYKSALAILDFTAATWPDNYVSFADRADIYQFYDKNPQEAESNLKKVIQLKPDYVQAYEDLRTLYTSSDYPGGQAKALPVLLLGLKNNPQSVDLMTYVARYYRSTGDKANANAYYDKAVETARPGNNANLADSIAREEQGV